MPRTKLKAKVKAKPKIKRPRRMEYRCIGKNESVINLTFQEKNEHGAFNNKIIPTPYFNLTFQHSFDPNKLMNADDVAPVVLFAKFEIQTSNKETYDKYIIGGIYKDLPVSAR